MGWNSQYALDGFFLFGAPLNVTRYVIDPADNKFGQSTDTYWVARFELDEEIDVIARLNDLSRRSTIYPVVSLLRRSGARSRSGMADDRFHRRPGALEGSGPSLGKGVDARTLVAAATA
jgi:hypothetical protein